MQAITALFFFYFDRKSEHFCDDTLSGKMPDELTMIKIISTCLMPYIFYKNKISGSRPRYSLEDDFRL